MASGVITREVIDEYDENKGNIEGRIIWESVANPMTNSSMLTLTFQVRSKHGWLMVDTVSGYLGIYKAFEEMYNRIYVEDMRNLNLTVDSEWVQVVKITREVPHDENGVCALSVQGVLWWPYDGTYIWSDYITLDTIDFTATVVSAPNFTDEQNPKITYMNPRGDKVDSLQVCIANATGTDMYAYYREVSKTGTSYTFNLTTAERNRLRQAAPASTTLEVSFVIKTTYQGKIYTNSLNKTLTIIPVAPLLSPVVEDVNITTTSLTGNSSVIVKGYSNMTFTLIAEPQKYAAMKSYSVINGANKSTSSYGTFNKVEYEVFEFSATDARGKTAQTKVNLDIVNYFPISCQQNVILARNEDDESNSQAVLTVSGNCFTGSFGKVRNSIKVESRHREKGGSWSEWADITVLVSDFSNNTYKLTANMSGFNVSGVYEFECRASDALTSATTGTYTLTFTPVFDWSATDFNFNVPVSITGGLLEDYVVATGTEAMGSNGTWYWSKWKSGRAECYGCRNYGNMAVNGAWGSIYVSDGFSQSLPSGLFNTTPEYIDIRINRTNDGAAWIFTQSETNASKTSTGGFMVCRPTAYTLQQVYIGFHVIGRWK